MTTSTFILICLSFGFIPVLFAFVWIVLPNIAPEAYEGAKGFHFKERVAELEDARSDGATVNSEPRRKPAGHFKPSAKGIAGANPAALATSTK